MTTTTAPIKKKVVQQHSMIGTYNDVRDFIWYLESKCKNVVKDSDNRHPLIDVGAIRKTELFTLTWSLEVEESNIESGEFRNMDTRKVDACDLASDYKARRIEKQAAYSHFVKDRNLQPELSAKEFYKIFDESVPCLLVRGAVNRIPTEYTHILKETYSTVRKIEMLEKGVGFISWIDEHGISGSTPEQYIEYLVKI